MNNILEEDVEEICGYFYKILFSKNDFCIALFKSDDNENIKVVGNIVDFDFNTKYRLIGKFEDNEKFGFQFNLEKIYKDLSTEKKEIISFLSSDHFKGIGKKCATKIYEKLGDDALKIIKDDYSVLDTLDLTLIQKTSIIDGFNSLDNDYSKILFELFNIGFKSSESKLIIGHYGNDTLKVLYENPFRYYIEVYGIGFDSILKKVNNIEFPDKDIKYNEAFLIYILKEYLFKNGDLFLFNDELKEKYEKEFDNYDLILDKCIKDKYIYNDDNKIYLFNDYYDELFISDYLKRFKDETLKINDRDLLNSISNFCNNESIDFDDDQKEAVFNFFNNPFSIIIGGPGTGKTTLIKAMVDIFKNSFPFNDIVVLAPTGRASKRINELCGVQSKTIHSILRWNLDNNSFVINSSNPLTNDVIIIDEFSMVDSFLFANLLKACPNVKKICVIGDDNQLPSIRSGNVLKDLIDSECFPVTRLNYIHRQSEGNEIITLSREIIDKKINFSHYSSDVTFIDIANFKEEDLLNMINNDLNNGYTMDDIQVLSPMYNYNFGVNNLNISLQESFNPKKVSKTEYKEGKVIYRLHDKVIQLKNKPDDDIYNGDIGIIEDIDLKEKSILIDYGNVLTYCSFSDLNELSLAYALTVHKAQGSEYKVVYFICSKRHAFMLKRKLIYTAVSRAKIKLVVVTDKEFFNKAINIIENERKTFLCIRLKQ